MKVICDVRDMLCLSYIRHFYSIGHYDDMFVILAGPIRNIYYIQILCCGLENA